MIGRIDSLIAALSGRYAIEREIGAGGMATVYLARDVRHNRRVALKVLKPELGAVLGVDRFLAEIQVTANLQHPNLLPLFDSGEAEGQLFYVMPFVEGESLRHRIDREKQLPVAEAVRIATAVASALAYAHERGVIHRDLKPENILLQAGQPVIADFGIALAVSNAGGTRVTQTGLSLGTPQYMSPEQATGDRDIDGRTDIYSLGAVTYEMLSGEPPHSGTTAQAIIAKLLSSEPQPITALRRAVPPNVEAAVSAALEKLPADRFATATEFARALSDPGYRRAGSAPAPTGVANRPSGARQAVPWVIAAAAIALAAVATLDRSAGNVSLPGPIITSINLEGAGLGSAANNSFAISPDGRRLAVAVERHGDAGIGIRGLDSIGIRYLPRTRGANHLFWSPDSKSIGFFAEGSLRIVDLASGSVKTLCRASQTHGGAWSTDGTILFSSSRTALSRVPASGGECTPLPIRGTYRDRALRPYFFPDGRHFIATGDQQVWMGELGGDTLYALAEQSRSEAVLAPPDILLRRGPDGLLAQRIDVRNRRLLGDPVRILPTLGNPGGHTAVAASATGVLVTAELEYRLRANALEARAPTPPGAATQDANRPGDNGGLGWVQRESATLETRAITEPVWTSLRTSRDGRRLSLGGWNIQALDIASGTWSRIGGNTESGREVSTQALWGPGDTAVVFIRNLSVPALRIANLRTGVERTLTTVPYRGVPRDGSGQLDDWSPDGRRILFESIGPDSGAEARAWEYDIGADTARILFEAPGNVSELRYAPNGQWIAYEVGVGGEADVFVRRYGADDAPVRVSSGGGLNPRWRADGAELFYLTPGGAVMAVPVRYGNALALGAPQLIVRPEVFGSSRPSDFAVAPDGQRFYFVLRRDVTALSLVVDWQKLFERAR